VFVIPALKTAEAAGSARAANVVLLGALAAVLGIAPDLWLQVIDSRVPERFRQLNRKAFESGRSLVRK
jgi:indolepyruvate ferredoxin oxidoreductase beta subunit